MARHISKTERVVRHTVFCILIYMLAHLLVFQFLPSWIGFVFVMNMAWGSQQIDAVFKKMGTSTLLEAYTFLGSVKFLAMALAWPLVLPLLKEKSKIYQLNLESVELARMESEALSKESSKDSSQ